MNFTDYAASHLEDHATETDIDLYKAAKTITAADYADTANIYEATAAEQRESFWDSVEAHQHARNIRKTSDRWACYGRAIRRTINL